MLREFANRVRRLSRRTDDLARLGGDEFAIVRHDRESLSSYAQRLIAGISEPFDLSGKSVRIGVSIGISTANALGPREPAELLAAADAALCRVKNGAKNGIGFAA